jgi:hypothetical protein
MIKWKRNPNLLLIILFCIQFISIHSYINLQFEYINKKTNSPIPDITTISSYFESYLENSIYTTIKVNNKNIKFYLTFDRYATYISESTLNQLMIKPSLIYDEDNEEQLYSLEYIGISRTSFGKTEFNFIQNNTQTISINNISFFISKKTLDESLPIKKAKCLSDNNEEIGFNIYKGNKISEVEVEQDDPFEDLYPNPNDNHDYDEDDYEYGDNPNNNRNKKTGEKYINKNNGYEIEQNSNIINQLKSLKLIPSYAFTIKYNINEKNNQEKGEIIIGSLPHEYDPRHYSEKYFTYTTIAFNKKTPAWRVIFDDIRFGNEKLISSNMAELSINFGFISASVNHKQIFDVNFFLKPEFVDYCKEEKVNTYYVKYCKENVIKEFKNIIFDLPKPYNSDKGDKIEFNYKDLFVKCPGNNDYYCFQIVFGSMSSAWILGKPLFKKYQMVFDQEKKIFGFYKEIGEYEYEEKKSNGNSGRSIPWIIIAILLIIIGFLGFLFYRKFQLNKRKKIANELQDDFVYELSVKKNNDENKNQLFNSQKNNFLNYI